MSCTSFCAKHRAKIEILTPTKTVDAEGYRNADSYAVVETVYGTKQPLSGELAEKLYGLTDRKISELLFIRGPVQNLTPHVDEGRLVRVNDIVYDVRAIKDWGAHKEVPIKPYKQKVVIT